MLELKNILTVSVIMELQGNNIGDFCDNLIDADNLIEIIESDGTDRKQFCDYLGIGESTLTGWIKDDRIPRMAKQAYILRSMVSRLQSELQKEKSGLKIVKAKSGYQICLFEEDEDGCLIGRTLAEGLETIKVARLLASSISTLKLLNETKHILNDKIDSLDGYFPTGDFEKLRDDITETTLFLVDYEVWRKSYGKRHGSTIPDVDLSLLDINPNMPQNEVSAPSMLGDKYTITIQDKEFSASSLGDILQIFLCKAYERKGDFLERLSKKSTRGNGYIVAKKDEFKKLYPRSGETHTQREQECEIADEWIFTKNISKEQLIARLKMSCEVAGLVYGSDVIFKEKFINITLEDLGL